MNETTLRVARVVTATSELEEICGRALHDVHAKRGGSALLITLCDGAAESALFERVIAASSLWTIGSDDELWGFAVVRERIIEILYVDAARRRHGVATTLVRNLLAGELPPIDGYALPGDRAMKSLYESLGWKARLLTMRGA